MKFKYKIRRTIKIRSEVLEEKIDNYLSMNSYRIIERGKDYFIFVEDDFSNRKKRRSDFHTRIGEGKFIFNNTNDNETNVELIFFTSLNTYIVIVFLACGFGIYVNNLVMPTVFTLAFAIPILYKILYLNERVFEDIIKC